MGWEYFWRDRSCAACGHVGPGRLTTPYLLNAVVLGTLVLTELKGGSELVRTSRGYQYVPYTMIGASLWFFDYLLRSPNGVRCPECGGIYG